MTAKSSKKQNKNVSWGKLSRKFLIFIKDKPVDEILNAIEKKCGVRPLWPNVRRKFSDLKIRRPKIQLAEMLSREEREEFRKKYPGARLSEVKQSIAKTFPEATSNQIFLISKQLGIAGTRALKGIASQSGKNEKAVTGAKLTDKQKILLGYLARAPQGVDLSDLATELEVRGKKDIQKCVEGLSKPLDARGYSLFIDEKTAVISRKGFDLREPKVFPIEMSTEQYYGNGANVCIFSGLYYGSDGFREGLGDLNQYIQKTHGAHFSILAGGLVDGREMSIYLRSALRGEKLDEKALWEQVYLTQIAKELSMCLPRLKKPDGELVKLYILTSPILDKEIGSEIAKELAELRKEDVVYWGDRNDQTLLVKHLRDAFNLLPVSLQRTGLRSKFASTKIQSQIRVILKVLKHAPDFAAFGGYGVSIHKPAVGEAKCPYIGLPNLHVPSERETKDDAESEVGTRVVKIRKDGNYTVTFSDFKELVRNERFLIKVPPSATDLQKSIIEVIKERPTFLGVLADRLGKSREEIKNAADALERFRAGLIYDERRKLYDFSNNWLQSKIRYRWPEKFCEETIVSGACVHALATYPDGTVLTDVKFFLDELPRIILENRASTLVIAGDGIQGSKVHNLHLRGEVFLGMDLNTQEHVYALLVGMPMITAFKAWFSDFMKDKKPESLTREALLSGMNLSLVSFAYCAGNHDLWQTGDAVKALAYFRDKLKEFLMREIAKTLKPYGLEMDFLTLSAFVDSKIVKDLPDGKIRYVTPCGIKVKIIHPHTARNETLSIPPERLLAKYPDAQVVIAGNWHTAFDMQQSDENIGARQMVQCPTLLLRTFFEDNKMKRTDFGVNITKIRSFEKRVYEIETGFFGSPIESGYERENNRLMEQLLHDHELDVFSSQYGKKAVEESKAPQ